MPVSLPGLNPPACEASWLLREARRVDEWRARLASGSGLDDVLSSPSLSSESVMRGTEKYEIRVWNIHGEEQKSIYDGIKICEHIYTI